MYSFEEVKDQSSTGGKYIKPGNHKIVDIKIECKQLKTAKYDGEVIEAIFVNDKGEEGKKSIFPFTPNANSKHFRGEKKDQPMSAEDQLKDYLANIMHTFKNFMGGKTSDENTEIFKKVMNKLTTYKPTKDKSTFAYLAELLGKGIEFNVKKGVSMGMMFIADKKGFTQAPGWTGGFTALSVEELPAFDNDKYGKKVPTASFEASSFTSSADALFTDEDKGASPFKDSPSEGTEKMFWED